MARQNNQRQKDAAATASKNAQKVRPARKQPKADSKDPRVNYDNTRESRFHKDVEAQESRKSRKGYDKPMKGAKFGNSESSNDVAWYAHTPELLRASASIPFTDAVGDRFKAGIRSFPGVCVLDWVPVIDGDPVNASANSHYSFTVHANSRNYQYDAPDQMMMIIAGADLFCILAAGIRAYGTMRRYNGIDRYTPEALITAMGFDFADLQSNLSNMWFDLNEMVSRSSQIWIPKDMPIIERWFWMSTHIYKDSDSAKAQYYMYVPRLYCVMSETGEAHGTSLSWQPFRQDTPLTWDRYKTIVNNMFNALLQSQDRGIIFGDLLAAYGPERIYGIAGITADYMIEPVYDAEVLSQFENAVVHSYYRPTYTVQSPNTGYISTQSALSTVPSISGHLVAPWTFPLNFHQANAPTPEQIMVATRLSALGIENRQVSETTPGAYMPKPYACGTEVCSHRIFFEWNYPAGGARTLVSYELDTCVADASLAFPALQAFMAFDWAGGLFDLNDNTSVLFGNLDPTEQHSRQGFLPANWLQEIDNFSWVDADTILKTHLTAVYSLFGVPTLL